MSALFQGVKFNLRLSRFLNNAAHSNGNTGLAVNRRLGDGHTIIGCSTYTPLVDPLNRRSEYQPIYFDTFHGILHEIRIYEIMNVSKIHDHMRYNTNEYQEIMDIIIPEGEN